jgi:acyl carrier protein
MESSIEDSFKQLIADNLGLKDIGAVTDNATINSLGGDSLDVADIAMKIQEEYNLKRDILDDLPDNDVTMKQIWDYVQKNRDYTSD